MPDLSNVHVDPTALIALGFLGAIVVLSALLFGWLTAQMGKKKPHSNFCKLCFNMILRQKYSAAWAISRLNSVNWNKPSKSTSKQFFRGVNRLKLMWS